MTSELEFEKIQAVTTDRQLGEVMNERKYCGARVTGFRRERPLEKNVITFFYVYDDNYREVTYGPQGGIRKVVDDKEEKAKRAAAAQRRRDRADAREGDGGIVNRGGQLFMRLGPSRRSAR